MDYPFYFVLQVLRRSGLAAAFQQFTQFGAKGGDFAVMGLQFPIAALVQHRQWVDRTIECQFAPQPREDIGAPIVGDAGSVQIIEPKWRGRVAYIAQPSVAMAGEHHAPVAIAKCAFGAGGKDAASLGQLRGHCVLAAKAVLQQDQLGIGCQPMLQLCDSVLGVVGFACH